MDLEGADLSLRIDDSDIRIFKQIFVDNECDSLNLPDAAETIVDLGANIGLSALFFRNSRKIPHLFGYLLTTNCFCNILMCQIALMEPQRNFDVRSLAVFSVDEMFIKSTL